MAAETAVAAGASAQVNSAQQALQQSGEGSEA
jgi:hypothetical protein